MCATNICFLKCETQNSTTEIESEKNKIYAEAPEGLVKHTQEFTEESKF